MDARLILNGVEIKLGHKELIDICFFIKDCDRNTYIFHELAKSQSPELRAGIADKEHLKDETIDMLLNDSSLEVMRSVIRNDSFKSRMNREILERYIETGDTEILTVIAGDIDDYTDVNDICEMDWLCGRLMIEKDPNVRYELAGNEKIPFLFLQELTEDHDINVAEKAQETLLSINDAV